MNQTEAMAYLLRNGFDVKLIKTFGKKRCIEVAMKHKQEKEKKEER